MANYDIIGGIVSPEALKEIQMLEKSVDEIAAKLQGMTLGSASKGDAAMAKQIKDLEAQIKRLTAAKAQGLTVDAKVEQQMQRQQQKFAAIANSSSQYVTELQKMEARMKLLNIELQKMVANKQTESQAYLKGIGDMKRMTVAYEQMSKASGMAQMKSTSMYGSTFQLTQVMRELPNFAIDARIGFMALSNNLPMLTDSFSMLSKQINETTGRAYGAMGAFKIFARSLLSANTAMIIISTLLVLYGKDLVNWIGNVSDAEKAQKEFNKAIKEGNGIYGDATKEVSRMNVLVGAAQKGYIDAEDAVSEYNKTLGKSLGEVNTLNEVYEKLNEKGDDYIEVIYRMQLANVYLQQSNVLLGKAASISADYMVDAWDVALLRLVKVGEAMGHLQQAMKFTFMGQFGLAKLKMDEFNAALERTDEAEQILAKRDEKANKLKKQATDLLDSYKNSMESAWKFAKDKDIDLFPDADGSKVFEAYNKQIADLVRKLDELNQMVGGETAGGYVNSVEKRLGANELFYRTSLELLEEQKKGEQAKADGNADELLRIDDKYYLKSLEAFRDYKSKQMKILNDASKDIENAVKAENEMLGQIQKDAVDGWLEKMRKSRQQNIKDIQENAKKEIQIEKEKEQLREQLLRDSITGAMELINSLNELYIRKLEEQGERMEQIEQAKLDEIKLKEEAGLLSKIQAEEEKARIADYYASVQEDLDRQKAEADRNAFLMKQAMALGEIWVNFAMASASLENLLAAGAFTPLYLGLALTSTGIIAAQTIPAFADGGIMDKTGKALLGDGGKNELAILPDGRMFITPDVPTVFSIPRGTEIMPDINAIDLRSLIAMKQVMPSYSGSDGKIINELRDVKKAIQQKGNGNFYGMPLIKQIGQSERFYYRKRSLMN